MGEKRPYRSRGVTLIFLAGFVCMIAGPPGANVWANGKERAVPRSDAAAAGDTGAIAGFIYADDHTTPVSGAVVRLLNIDTRKEYRSSPTNGQGMYWIMGFEGGRYLLGVKTPAGGYNFEYEVFLKEKTLAKLSLSLEPKSNWSDDEAAPKKERPSFFKSPVGIVALVVVAEAVLYGLLSKEDEVSPVVIR